MVTTGALFRYLTLYSNISSSVESAFGFGSRRNNSIINSEVARKEEVGGGGGEGGGEGEVRGRW